MINIILKDGSIRQVEKGTSVLDFTKTISEGLARSAIVARVSGALVDLNFRLGVDKLPALTNGNKPDHYTFEVYTFADKEGKEVFWHTASHILASAVKNVFPTAKLAIGPSTKNGFYYDFDFAKPITQDDFKAIEEQMQKIIKADLPMQREDLSKKDAEALFKGFKENYKLELINDLYAPNKETNEKAKLSKDEKVGVYKTGAFADLCQGPHLLSTGKIKAFKLLSLTGAYWKGSEKNKMLSRIYGVAFEKKSHLDEFLIALEEAKARDHNKIGRELGYFATDESIGQGLPFLMPKGAKLFQILSRFVEDEEERRGYKLIKTPVMAKSDLYKISGHWQHYKDDMFVIGDEKKDKEVFALRPMSCPYAFLVYKQGLKSYKDLPLRYNETVTLMRNESSGEMHGLIRMRQFTLSDGHIICLPEQIKDEFKRAFELTKFFLQKLGLQDDVWFRFSKWDKNNKQKYIDKPREWESTQNLMENIFAELGIKYETSIGDAAFYGPKLDIQTKNVHGKEDTIMTIQVDFALAERFDLTYIAEDGAKKYPYVIHRSAMGCYERTIAMLLEKYVGALPFWLSPTQVKVLSISDKFNKYAGGVADKLLASGIRTELDIRGEKIGKKIREAQLDKSPYMIIIGEKEQAEKTISVRKRASANDTTNNDLGSMKLSDFTKLATDHLKNFT
ncbi:MAG: threonine--tRNA ligase [Firmicutes bacterium]|nr:threonine--tRNA ligase [Bacillota bacterium]